MEGRYATALFSAASKQNKLDQTEQELGKVSVSQMMYRSMDDLKIVLC